MSLALSQADPEVAAAVDHETLRQHEGLEMIASENFVSEAVLEAAGSVFTNKYAEGYPGRRYYGGCEFTDVVENVARDRAKQIFGGEHANVQPHSGSQANAAAYAAVLQPGDTILGLDLAHGGHLTHGHKLSFSGKLYRPTFYTVRRDTETIDDLLIKLPDGRIAGGMKMANGTNSRRAPPFPGTRAKSAALVREMYFKAQEYKKKLADAASDPAKAPPRDLIREGLVEVLDGKRIVQHHTHRHDDIMTVIRLANEFHFNVVAHHASDAWMVADQIAAAKVPVSLILIDSPGSKLEAKDVRLETAAILEKAGVKFGFHTDDPIIDSRLFIREAGLGVRAGLSRAAALRALTLSNAEILGLQDRVGSLDPGKDADFIVLSGDPLSIYSHVLETWVEGKKRFDRSNPEDRLYAVGGFGASRDQEDIAGELDEEAR